MAVTNYYSINGQIIGESTNGVRTDYLTDALGSVTGTVNQSGVVVNTYRYKPYGDLLSKTGAGADPAFGWVGTQGYKQTQKKFSNFYVRARHYGSAQGKWTTVDPMGIDGGDVNLYRYVINNPVKHVDPSGNFPLVCAGACILCASCAIDLAFVCNDCRADLNCWKNCISGTINELPPVIKWGCGIACAGCLACLGNEALKQYCEDKPPCTPAEIAALQSAVIAACKTGERRCTGLIKDCAILKANFAANIACYTARHIINVRCFAGGDDGHRQAEQQAFNAALKCARFIKSNHC